MTDLIISGIKYLLFFTVFVAFLPIALYVLGFLAGIFNLFFNLFCSIGVSASSINLLSNWSGALLFLFICWKIFALLFSD